MDILKIIFFTDPYFAGVSHKRCLLTFFIFNWFENYIPFYCIGPGNDSNNNG